MTRAQVKKALRANKRAGVRPWSMYQLAQMRPCSRSFVTVVLQGKVKSAPFFRWCETVFRHAGAEPPTFAPDHSIVTPLSHRAKDLYRR